MNLTCYELLQNYGQTEKSIENFWRPLILATLNTDPEIAHSENLLAVLRLGFFKGGRASRLVFPNKPFSEVFGNPASDYLLNNNVKIELGKSIRKIIRENENYWLSTNKEKYGPLSNLLLASVGDGNKVHGPATFFSLFSYAGGYTSTWAFYSFEQAFLSLVQ